MIEPRAILDAIRGAIEAARPDGRYALEGDGIAPDWLVSPDQDDQLSPRDLLCQVLLGGPTVQGQALVYPVSVLVVLTSYSGERTSRLSGRALTSYERAHGACLHLLEVLSSAAIPGGRLAPVGYEMPRPTDPPDYLTSLVLLTATVASR